MIDPSAPHDAPECGPGLRDAVPVIPQPACDPQNDDRDHTHILIWLTPVEAVNIETSEALSMTHVQSVRIAPDGTRAMTTTLRLWRPSDGRPVTLFLTGDQYEHARELVGRRPPPT